MMSKKVTIVIPNYNGLAFMEDCMAALEAQTCKEFEVLVVDNGSTDGSAQWLKEREIPTIFLGENTGFSGAVNVGIRAAKTPYVILLNNDTKVHGDYVEAMVRAIERSPRIFSVSSKMIQMYHPELMDDAGDMYTVLGWAYQRGVGQPSGGYRRPVKVFSACAGAASTGGRSSRRSAISTRTILPISRTWTWAIGRRYSATTTSIVRRPSSITWGAGPAVPSTTPSR